MTFAHLGLLALGAALGTVGGLLLGRRSIGRWPLALLTLVLAFVGGYTYSAELLAFAVGIGLPLATLAVMDRVNDMRQTRRRRQASVDARRAQEERFMQDVRSTGVPRTPPDQ